MVVLKNINRDDNYISADYYPENNKAKGFMKINITNEEIVEHDCASNCASAHVLRELRRLAKVNNLPKVKKLLWY